MLSACLRLCHLCVGSLTVIQHLICAQPPFSFILEPPAILDKHQLNPWPDRSLRAPFGGVLCPEASLESFILDQPYFGAGFIYGSSMCARQHRCWRGNIKSERDTREGTLCSRAIQTSQLVTGSEQSRPPIWILPPVTLLWRHVALIWTKLTASPIGTEALVGY